MEPDAGIGPVNKLNETLKLSNVLQFSKLDGIVPERKFRERSRSVAVSVEAALTLRVGGWKLQKLRPLETTSFFGKAVKEELSFNGCFDGGGRHWAHSFGPW
ncbi:hypothetical protein C1H46_008784 [Malus baccata]|uniref:Uncharacterized protein n=1 Tax=Malus baccata TaxID=106549 RepID=A0A540N3N0_MALBA|nr:hypothetical protein C1H46_008784 [Malus baccata]